MKFFETEGVIIGVSRRGDVVVVHDESDEVEAMQTYQHKAGIEVAPFARGSTETIFFPMNDETARLANIGQRVKLIVETGGTCQ